MSSREAELVFGGRCIEKSDLRPGSNGTDAISGSARLVRGASKMLLRTSCTWLACRQRRGALPDAVASAAWCRYFKEQLGMRCCATRCGKRTNRTTATCEWNDCGHWGTLGRELAGDVCSMPADIADHAHVCSTVHLEGEAETFPCKFSVTSNPHKLHIRQLKRAFLKAKGECRRSPTPLPLPAPCTIIPCFINNHPHTRHPSLALCSPSWGLGGHCRLGRRR